MASPLVRELLDAGIHFGHRCARWNPKMEPYIYGKRNGIHIIDIRETLRGLLRAKKFVTTVVQKGEDILFIGTKRQAREVVEEQADRCNMHYVSERWLGGTLTNFRTIRSRLQRLEELESLVDSPQWDTDYSKKMKSTLMRELKKIRRNLGGVRRLNRVPGCLVMIDLRKEHNAAREARALGIPTICLVDTDSDPGEVTVPIPGNDDSMRSIAVILRQLADAVEEGMKARPAVPETPRTQEGPDFGAPPRRRGRRGTGGGGPPRPAPQQQQPESAPADTAVATAEAPPTPPPAEAPAGGGEGDAQRRESEGQASEG